MIKTPNFENDAQLFNYVRNFDLNNIPSLENIFSSYSFNYISIHELEDIIFTDKILLIDSRSENEYKETSIPGSINFPVLNTLERHNVGLIYRKYSQTAAVKLALEYTEPKIEILNEFLISGNAGSKNIVVYCWRGGGRSKFLAKMITDLGYNVKVLIKGIKSYRNNVVKLFKLDLFPHKFLELRGMTGCGKSEILNMLKNKIPIIDLEDAARNYSSLFGQIPYKLKDIEPVLSQIAFENNIYEQYLYNKSAFPINTIKIIESESRKVGNFTIPINIYSEMISSRCINIHSSLHCRVDRIESAYFSNKDKGIAEISNILILKEKFFRKEMSNKYFESAFHALKKGNTQEFCEIMLTKYYDFKYRVKDKIPLADICSENIEHAAWNVEEIYFGIN